MDPESLIARLPHWRGHLPQPPWSYRCTVAIPHLDTLPQLALVLDLWRAQTVRPYLVVVDTGSPAAVLAELEKLRAPDLEIHAIRGHGWRHPCAPITAALDLAQALCRTEVIIHAHADVFPRRRDLAAMLLGQCDHGQPVVGWQMSPRDMSTSPNRDEWRTAVSHTCTALHMPTVHRAGLTWAIERYYAERPSERGEFAAWPDTESGFFVACQRAGLAPLLLGPEENFKRHGNDWWDHARSYTGLKAMAADGSLETNMRLARAIAYVAEAEREARERLATWTAADTAKAGVPQEQSREG